MRLCALTMRLLFFLTAFWVCGSLVFAQDSVPTRQGPDVVRVNTSLVQTDVMVFDSQGNFVDGLKRDQFVLKVDGKPRDISFFERVVAGSRNEEAQLAAARGNSATGTRAGNPGPAPLDRGRTVFFFVDDVHLSLGSLKQTKLMLERFIEREMGQNDEAAIASTSGQIGFLQQLSDDKAVLRAAADRLMVRSSANRDSQRPPMSEYQAQLIQGESYDVLEYFVDELMRISQVPRNIAAEEIRGRALQIAQQSSFIAASTLNSLRALIKNAAGLPGRKVVFMISDGFLLDKRDSDSYDRLRQVTAAAATSGVIIYSIDARGLAVGLPDASTEMPFDPSGRLSRAAGGEMGATQNVLSALATETGGRAFFNNNNLAPAVSSALKETSAYYLLAWRPEGEQEAGQKPRRIEVSVIGRPKLLVRFHRGFGDSSASEPATRKKTDRTAAAKPANDLISETLRSPYPKSDLPVAISLHFLDLAQVGPTLTTSIKISAASLKPDFGEDGSVALLDLAGGVFDDRGKPVCSFNKRLTIRSKSDAKSAALESVFYNHYCIMKPGLYQVRVAALDTKRARTGSAVRWITVPDLNARNLTMSSLIVGERKTESPGAAPTQDETEAGNTAAPLQQVTLNVDHRFASSSVLRFLTFIYNASGTQPASSISPPTTLGTTLNSIQTSSTIGPAAGPDLAVQVQMFRDNEPVITAPLHKIQVEPTSDQRRLPYAAEVSLEGLAPGPYVLLVTIIDRAAKSSASQKFRFRVD